MNKDIISIIVYGITTVAMLLNLTSISRKTKERKKYKYDERYQLIINEVNHQKLSFNAIAIILLLIIVLFSNIFQFDLSLIVSVWITFYIIGGDIVDSIYFKKYDNEY